MTRPTITRMNRFSRYSVKLSCGHTFEATPSEVADKQLFIGKAVECKPCQDAATEAGYDRLAGGWIGEKK
jgi:hypothetical protein